PALRADLSQRRAEPPPLIQLTHHASRVHRNTTEKPRPVGKAGRGFLVRSICAHIRLRGARTVVQATDRTVVQATELTQAYSTT
ncbi:hypothetical protein, partial [uncultured Bradyrhizobium sp.]|uniref:hypothetical protein n=1 Tax=uncultured Bradyrhizobium sp. TaxID=199684 RepID=UPI0027D96AD5